MCQTHAKTKQKRVWGKQHTSIAVHAIGMVVRATLQPHNSLSLATVLLHPEFQLASQCSVLKRLETKMVIVCFIVPHEPMNNNNAVIPKFCSHVSDASFALRKGKVRRGSVQGRLWWHPSAKEANEIVKSLSQC